jgi:HK97 family phage prohead protease
VTDLIRSFAPELEVRSSAKGGDGRTIEGIAVPYNRPQRISPQLIEQFARGAFDHQTTAPNRVFFSRGHMDEGGVLIGKAIELRDDAAGLWGAWRVSATPTGEETLTLVKDGVLDELSVGFQTRQDRREPDGTITRVKANLVEVSVVLEGAYGRGALVSAVRAKHGCSCDCHAEDDATSVVPMTRNLDTARRILAGMRQLPA